MRQRGSLLRGLLIGSIVPDRTVWSQALPRLGVHVLGCHLIVDVSAVATRVHRPAGRCQRLPWSPMLLRSNSRRATFHLFCFAAYL